MLTDVECDIHRETNEIFLERVVKLGSEHPFRGANKGYAKHCKAIILAKNLIIAPP